MFRGPSKAGLPPFSLMLKDLPATQQEIARHLDLTERTVSTYLKHESAPRAVQLAVFWETRWGRSAADCEAANWGAVYYRKAMALERENERLRAQLATMEDLRNDGAANTPYFQLGR